MVASSDATFVATFSFNLNSYISSKSVTTQDVSFSLFEVFQVAIAIGIRRGKEISGFHQIFRFPCCSSYF